jgi:tetratricopeptide (TPR) repeat protein
VAEAIESLHADDLAPHAAALGLHFLAAEVWPRAITCLRQAGNRAFAHAAYRDAVPYFEHALAALERLPVDERRIEDTVDMRLEFGSCLTILAELDRCSRVLHEAQAAAEAAGDRERLHRIFGFRGNHHWWMAEYDRSERVLEHARSFAAPDHDESEMELWYRAVNGHARGEYRAALDLLEQAARKASEESARRAVTGAPAPRRPASPTYFRVWCLVELGHFDEALAWAEHDVQLAEAMPHAYRLTLAASVRGLVHLRRGDAVAALGPLEYGLNLAMESSFRAAVPRTAGWLALAYAAANRGREALSLVEQSVDRALPLHRGPGSAILAEAYLHMGRIEEAAALADEVLPWTAERGERGTHAWLLWLSAEIGARRSPPAGAEPGAREAEARYLRALAAARDLEMRPLVARCHLGLGSLPGSAAKRAQRREHVETARLMFGEMGMRSWRERADALLVSTASA